MTDSVFGDTHVLVHAHDLDAGRRHETAKRLIQALCSKPVWPYISVRVLRSLGTSPEDSLNPHGVPA